MAKLHWAHSADGTFAIASNWNPAQIPGSNDEADLDAGGAYTVAVSANASVQTLFVADTGATLALSTGKTFTLGSGTSVNLGTIDLLDGSNSVSLFVSSAGSTLINAGTINIGSLGQMRISGTLKNFGSINVAASALLVMFGNAQLTGGGKVSLAGGVITGGSSGASLTNVDNAITGAGSIGDANMLFVNDTTVGATLANQTLSMGDATNTPFVNNGVMYAYRGHMILVGPVTNNATIAAVQGPGKVEVKGVTIGNKPGAMLVAALGGIFLLDDQSEILGGTLSSASGGSFQVASSSAATLNGGAPAGPLNIAADVEIGKGAALTLLGTINSTGTLNLEASNALTRLVIVGNVTLQGAGNVNLQTASAAVLSNGTSATLTNVGGTLSGQGFIGDSKLSIINRGGGVILANQNNAD